jgi:hypothetical protein
MESAWILSRDQAMLAARESDGDLEICGMPPAENDEKDTEKDAKTNEKDAQTREKDAQTREKDALTDEKMLRLMRT